MEGSFYQTYEDMETVIGILRMQNVKRALVTLCD